MGTERREWKGKLVTVTQYVVRGSHDINMTFPGHGFIGQSEAATADGHGQVVNFVVRELPKRF